MAQEYPRQPSTDEYRALLTMEADARYPDDGSCIQERHDLAHQFDEACDSGGFIITQATSDSPGFCGLLAFIIWPDTSVTMYRKGTGSTSKGMIVHDRQGIAVHMDEWYSCDKDGVPWL